MLGVYNVKFLLLSLIPLSSLALRVKASRLGSVFLGSIARSGLIGVRLVIDVYYGRVLG